MLAKGSAMPYKSGCRYRVVAFPRPAAFPCVSGVLLDEGKPQQPGQHQQAEQRDGRRGENEDRAHHAATLPASSAARCG